MASDENGENSRLYPVEMLNNFIARSALFYENLMLEVGFPVILLCDIKLSRGHVNRTAKL